MLTAASVQISTSQTAQNTADRCHTYVVEELVSKDTHTLADFVLESFPSPDPISPNATTKRYLILKCSHYDAYTVDTIQRSRDTSV